VGLNEYSDIKLYQVLTNILVYHILLHWPHLHVYTWLGTIGKGKLAQIFMVPDCQTDQYHTRRSLFLLSARTCCNIIFSATSKYREPLVFRYQGFRMESKRTAWIMLLLGMVFICTTEAFLRSKYDDRLGAIDTGPGNTYITVAKVHLRIHHILGTFFNFLESRMESESRFDILRFQNAINGDASVFSCSVALSACVARKTFHMSR
jgi:hypothetical protein